MSHSSKLATVDRRRAVKIAAAGMVAMAASPASAEFRAVPMHIYRDPNCGCCHVWSDQMSRTGLYQVIVHEDADMNAVKSRFRVPAELSSCHTAIVDGLVIEGHVPAEAIARARKTRPRAVYALVVPGMPAGSPGMEQPGGGREAFDVIAISADASRSVFAHYPAINR